MALNSMSFRLHLGLGRLHYQPPLRPQQALARHLPAARALHHAPRRPLPPSFFGAGMSTSSGILHSLLSRSDLPISLPRSLRRAFSSSKLLKRQNYYPQTFKGSGGGSSGGPIRPGWFARLRYRLDSYPPMYIIWALIGLNVAVFLLWQYAVSSWTRFRDPSLLAFMKRNFVISELNLMQGRIWTLITSAFSHSSGDHILVNLLGLYFVAPAALSVLPGSAFLGLYLGGGLAASVTSLIWHRIQGQRNYQSEGASGAIYATLGFYGLLFPRAQALLFFIIPMPIWVLVGGVFAWDLFSAVSNRNSRVDAAAHVGGLTAGLLAAARFRRGGGIGGMFGGRRW